jgi:transposase
MSRYRLSPSPAQEAALRDHCGHARYVGNLAVEQHSHWHPGRTRESQAVFRCTACGYARNADVNAARNIAAGHPTHLPIPLHLRGGCPDTGPVNCEPQLLPSLAGRQ